MNELIKKPEKLPKLRPRQVEFCRGYVLTGNATKAYIDAGYSTNGAQPSSSALLLNPMVKEYLAHLEQLANEELQITLKDVVPTLRRIKDKNEDERPHVSVSACAELSKIGRLYEPTVVNNTVIHHNSLQVIHAPGAMEAIEEERKQAEENK